MWSDVGEDLRGFSRRWWLHNKKSLIGMGRDELRMIAVELKAGNSKRAQMAILSKLDPNDPDDRKVWEAYRDGTTLKLRAAARRRHDMLKALERLGKTVAKLIGKAILAALL